MARIAGLDYTPLAQLPQIDLSVTTRLMQYGTEALTTSDMVVVNVVLTAKNIKKVNIVTAITRLFNRITIIASNNVPTPEPFNASEVVGETATEFSFSINDSEDISVGSLILNMTSIRYELLPLRLEEIIDYITEVVANDY